MMHAKAKSKCCVNLRCVFMVLLMHGLSFSIYANANFTQHEVRVEYKINQGWSYAPSTANTPGELEGTDVKWAAIDLPHTWNQWDAVDLIPGYRRSVGWYVRSLKLKPEPGKTYYLYFEGANMTSDVFVNGKRAGGHTGGYVGFSIDITAYLADSGSNLLQVRVDNSYNRDLIPSQKADFFIYGGLTRDVWLRTVHQTHFKTIAVSTPDVSAQHATVKLDVNVEGAGELGLEQQKVLRISARLLDENKRIVSETTTSDYTPGHSWTFTLPQVMNPLLWSPTTPSLYSLEVELYNGNELLDFKTETVGFRWFEFEDHGAFFINGQRLLLRGTHRHEEHAGFGAAMPDSLHYADIKQMKDVGVNFLRLGHYPQDPEVYRACNELGIIVWDELPWCRGGIGEETWQNNTTRLLEEQITQNFNHPSILFWSLGNEIYWLPDFPNGDDRDKINGFLRKLNDRAHQLDPYRMTAIRKYYEGADLVDVFSPSIWSGWYAGIFENYEATLDKNQQLYTRFLHMEYGGSSHVGRHAEDPITSVAGVDDTNWSEVSNQVGIKNMAQDGDWTESYIVDLFDHYLSVTETREGFAGNAQWAFKDFGTPLRPENAIPFMNQKGLVDRAGKPKDAYYVFKSYWSNDPFAYIESHTWTERAGPEGVSREIVVYSNQDSIELSLNGKSLGWRKRTLGILPAGGLAWDVPFQEGKNTLSALGPNGVSDEIIVTYSYVQASTADRIELSASRLENGNILIEATAVDKQGRRVLNYESMIYFDHNGEGKLLVNYGTPTRSQAIQMANGRATIEIFPALIGNCTIEARNQDFKGSYLTIDFAKSAGKTAGSSLGSNSLR